MITLQPIAKNIQQTLYEKMEMMKKTGGRSPNNRSYTIGEVVTSNSDPNLNYMMARSSWLRMVSLTPVNANNEAIIIMGGELTEKGGLKGEFVSHLQNGMGGKYSSIYYVHKYSPTDRRYDWIKKRTMPLRPLPGIKEASIEYKGGGMKLGATRTAEINWTCWTWEELDRLTPHFLDAGRSVLLEWGWTGLGKLNKIELLDIFKDGTEEEPVAEYLYFDKEKIKNLNQSILAHIQQQNGHYDAVLGRIQDFTWDVNETGGFDCTTTLVAQGVSMIAANERQKTSRGDKFANLPLLADTDDKSLSLASSINLLAPYISYQDYMEDFHNQILAPNTSNQVAIFAIEDAAGKYTIHGGEHSNLGTHGGGVYVSWGYFEDNVLSRFLSSVTPDKKVVGEFRSIEQATDDKGVLMFHSIQATTDDKGDLMFHSMGTGEDKVIDKNKPIMDSTRLTNCRYLITTNSSKWVIPNKFDPFLSSDKVIIMKKHADYGCVAQSWIGGTDGKDDGIESDWVKFALLDRAGESKSKESDNPVIQHFAPRNGILGNGEFDDTYMSIRNIFFNVDYLQKKCKGSGNLMKVVEDIWNDFSDDYGGVYKFKIEFDDNTNRLLIREEGYSRYDVLKLNKSLYQDFDDTQERMDNPLFEFPTMEQGSIVKTQTVSAKLPDRMKYAAMYGQRSVAKGTDDKNEDIIRGGTYDDIAGLAWGRMAEAIANPPDEEMSEEEKRNRRYADMISGDTDFPSRGNRAFGNLSASPDSSLIIGDVPLPTKNPESVKGAASILKSITEALNTSQQKYLTWRKQRIKKGTAGPATKVDKVDVGEIEQQVITLQKTFKLFSATGTTKEVDTPDKIGAIEAFNDTTGIYEETDYTADGESTKHCWSIKREAHSLLDKLLRGSPDGILKNINPLIPIDFEIEVDGTGGMFPGNSFHSSYLGGAYKDQSLFQMVGVNHVIDGTGWTTTIKGQIRAQSVLTKGISHVSERESSEEESNRRAAEAETALEAKKKECTENGGKWDDQRGCIYPEIEAKKVAKQLAIDDKLMELIQKDLVKKISENWYKDPDDPEKAKAFNRHTQLYAYDKVHQYKNAEWGAKKVGEFFQKTTAYSTYSNAGQPHRRFFVWFKAEVIKYYGAKAESESKVDVGKQIEDKYYEQGGFIPPTHPIVNEDKMDKAAKLGYNTSAAAKLLVSGRVVYDDEDKKDDNKEEQPGKNIGAKPKGDDGTVKGKKKSEGSEDTLAERTKKANSYQRHVDIWVRNSNGDNYQMKILEIHMPGGMKGPAGDRVRDNDGSLDIEGPFGGDGPPAGSKRTRRFVPFEKWDRLVKRYDDQFKDDDEEVENPGYPFTGENWDKTPFGITEPKWSNAAEARSAMIYQMGFDSWTDYKDVYSNAERKSHWDDNPNLWTSFEMYP